VKMTVAFILGVLAIAAVVLFFGPMRDRAERVMFEQPPGEATEKGELTRRPLTDAAAKTEKALKGAWESTNRAARKAALRVDSALATGPEPPAKPEPASPEQQPEEGPAAPTPTPSAAPTAAPAERRSP
jgi:hypothetical protein